MEVQGTVNAQDEAKKIWDQLEAEDGGNAQPPDDASTAPDAEDSQAADTTSPAPAKTADAKEHGDAPAPTGDQILLDKISGLETMLSQVTQRLRNAEGHIGGLGSQLRQQLQTAQQVSARVAMRQPRTRFATRSVTPRRWLG